MSRYEVFQITHQKTHILHYNLDQPFAVLLATLHQKKNPKATFGIQPIYEYDDSIIEFSNEIVVALMNEHTPTSLFLDEFYRREKEAKRLVIQEIKRRPRDYFVNTYKN